jgi:hypothetical protein
MDKQRPETKFKKTEEFAECKGNGLTCLSSERGRTIKSQPIIQYWKYIVNTPGVEVGKGRYWKNMQGIINGYA